MGVGTVQHIAQNFFKPPETYFASLLVGHGCDTGTSAILINRCDVGTAAILINRAFFNR